MRYLALSSIFLALGLVLTPPALSQAENTFTAKPVVLDRDQVFVGKQSFRLLNAGQPAGQVEVHSTFTEDGLFVLHDHSSSPAMGVHEDLLAVLDANGFAPRRVTVSGTFGEQYLNLVWQWKGRRVLGQGDQFRFDSGIYSRHAMDTELPEGTLTRATILYLANAMALKPNAVIEVNWFNSLNGQVEAIKLTVAGSETITVPAGTFDAFKVELTGGTPGHTLYVTTDVPRRIVRFDITGTQLQLELESL